LTSRSLVHRLRYMIRPNFEMTGDDDDFELVYSPLCQVISVGADSVSVKIYGDGKGKWILEVEDEHDNSTVWDDPFDTDQEALGEVLKTIREEGIWVLIDNPS
jgi:hypothetical protein